MGVGGKGTHLATGFASNRFLYSDLLTARGTEGLVGHEKYVAAERNAATTAAQALVMVDAVPYLHVWT